MPGSLKPHRLGICALEELEKDKKAGFRDRAEQVP